MKLNEKQEEWLAALESGEYEQTQESEMVSRDGRYCCLAVACKLAGMKDEEIGGADLNSHPTIRDSLNLIDGGGDAIEGYSLMSLNDEHCKTFPEIAAIVRANPEAYFKQEST